MHARDPGPGHGPPPLPATGMAPAAPRDHQPSPAAMALGRPATRWIMPVMAGMLSLLLSACAARAPAPPPGLAIAWPRYLGTWYELARFDHGFERGLVGVTADYGLRPDGRISVLNAGRRGTLDGEPSTARATARIAGPATLSVTFFWPFSGEYRVLAIADDYRWALVGSSTRSYLWFMHRSPRAPPADWTALEDAARQAGYDLQGLMRVPQPAAP